MILFDKDNLEFPSDGVGYNIDYEFPYEHTHTYWEFIFTLNPLLHKINGKTEYINKNAVLVIKPEDCHAICAETSYVNPHKHPTVLNLKISESELNALLMPMKRNVYGNLRKILFPPKTISEIPECIQTIIKLYKTQNFDAPPYIKAAINTILTLYADLIFSNENSKSLEIPAVFYTLIKRMQSPYWMNQPLNALTKDIPYSKMHLNRLMNKFYGCSLIVYFNELKLDYAKKMLLYTDKSMGVIANELGWSVSHFEHLFKKMFQTSPYKFKRILYKNNQVE